MAKYALLMKNFFRDKSTRKVPLHFFNIFTNAPRNYVPKP